MIPADKAKLDQIASIAAAGADANKVLTVNGAGTAATWVTPAAGGGSSLITYAPTASVSPAATFFVRATGLGVTANLTGHALTITIPMGVDLDYFRLDTNYVELGSQPLLDVTIIDSTVPARINTSYLDLVLPVLNIFDRNSGNASSLAIQSIGHTNFNLNVSAVSGGSITLHSSSLGNHNTPFGFSLTIRP
jgi:hypothetical protein